jgi:hypothetical protein
MTTDSILPPWLEGPYCEGFRFSLRRKKILASMELEIAVAPDMHRPKKRCYPTGIVHNYTSQKLEKLGFVKCYIAPYSQKTSFEEIMESCPTYIGDADFNMPLFFGACKSSKCEKIYLGSFTNDNRLLVYLGDPRIEPGEIATLANEETVWYGVKKISRKLTEIPSLASWIGFAPDTTVDFGEEHCDTYDSDNNDRLCWMTNHLSGGYRAGNHVDLEKDKSWHKVLYYSNRSFEHYSACNYESLPVQLNDVGMYPKSPIKSEINSGTATVFPILLQLALSCATLSLIVLLAWKCKGKNVSIRKACQWIASSNNSSINQLVTEEYKPLLVTTEQA